MSRYRWTGSGTFRDHCNDRSIEPGEVVEIDDAIARGWSEFVEAEEPEEAPEPAESEEPDEPDEPDETEESAEPEQPDDDEPEKITCAGNDGDCSRKVAEKGDRCWQHSDDE